MIAQACLRCGERQELVVDLDLRGVPHGFAGHDTVYDWDMEWSGQLDAATIDLLRRSLSTCQDAANPVCECAAHVSLRKTASDDGVPGFTR